MAVDVIPAQSDELFRVLFLIERLKAVKKEFSKMELERKFVEESAIPKKRRKYSYRLVLKVYETRIAGLEESLSKLPELCNNCTGKRSVDFSNSGQMAMVCPECKGKGLKKRG